MLSVSTASAQKGLQVGPIFDGKVVPSKIMKETVIRRAHQKTIALLERMDRSEAELRRRMKLDMYSESVTDETIAWLKSLHYLDDDRYAQNYIRSHIQSSSKQELISKLLAKGIKKDLIEEAYSVCSADTDLNESQAAVKTLGKKLGNRKTLTPKERMNAIGCMLRKGFRRNEIMAAFEELDIVIDYDEIPD